MTLLAPAEHGAQIRWDAAVELGATDRVTTGALAPGARERPGPILEAHAQLALFPLVRVGAYASADVTFGQAGPVRQMTEAGARLQIATPLLSRGWRLWIFSGIGYAFGVEPRYETARAPSGFVATESGGFLDVPVGVGVGFLRAPWMPMAELSSRFGAMFTGAMYGAAECGCGAAYAGRDSFAVALTLGVSWQR